MPNASSTRPTNAERSPGESSEARIAKALAHPLRAHSAAARRARREPGRARRRARRLLGVVSYHVRMLRDYDCVELVRAEPRRGALQYSACCRSRRAEAMSL